MMFTKIQSWKSEQVFSNSKCSCCPNAPGKYKFIIHMVWEGKPIKYFQDECHSGTLLAILNLHVTPMTPDKVCLFQDMVC